MDHLRFQSSQTAASYVAAQLDAQEQEAFELHMMSCPECVGEVESWRAIQQHLPGERRRQPQVAEPALQVDLVLDAAVPPAAAEPARANLGARTPRWRIAVSLAAVAIAGAAGGWFARSAQEPWAGSDDTAFYALRPIGRGAEECQSLRLDKNTSIVALRVTSTAPDQELAAVDSNGRDLTRFAVRTQADGSWVAKLRADSLGQPVRFEGRSADGTVEPLGCVVSAPRG